RQGRIGDVAAGRRTISGVGLPVAVVEVAIVGQVLGFVHVMGPELQVQIVLVPVADNLGLVDDIVIVLTGDDHDVRTKDRRIAEARMVVVGAVFGGVRDLPGGDAGQAGIVRQRTAITDVAADAVQLAIRVALGIGLVGVEL